MIPIELGSDAVDGHGFVSVGSVVEAIAGILLERGALNRFQAERDAWPHVHTAVVMGKLHPIASETLHPLSADHYGNGIVRFDELAEWGRSTGLYEFKQQVVAPLLATSGDQAAKESADQRQERLQKICNGKKAAGVRGWVKETAGEEKISVQMLRKILNRKPSTEKSKPGTINALKEIGKKATVARK